MQRTCKRQRWIVSKDKEYISETSKTGHSIFLDSFSLNEMLKHVCSLLHLWNSDGSKCCDIYVKRCILFCQVTYLYALEGITNWNRLRQICEEIMWPFTAPISWAHHKYKNELRDIRFFIRSKKKNKSLALSGKYFLRRRFCSKT